MVNLVLPLRSGASLTPIWARHENKNPLTNSPTQSTELKLDSIWNLEGQSQHYETKVY